MFIWPWPLEKTWQPKEKSPLEMHGNAPRFLEYYWRRKPEPKLERWVNIYTTLCFQNSIIIGPSYSVTEKYVSDQIRWYTYNVFPMVFDTVSIHGIYLFRSVDLCVSITESLDHYCFYHPTESARNCENIWGPTAIADFGQIAINSTSKEFGTRVGTADGTRRVDGTGLDYSSGPAFLLSSHFIYFWLKLWNMFSFLHSDEIIQIVNWYTSKVDPNLPLYTCTRCIPAKWFCN